MGTGLVLSVIGAGAMGAALAVHAARQGTTTALLATPFDAPVVDAWSTGRVHPALGIPFSQVECVPHDRWPDALQRSEILLLAVSSGGLADVVEEVALHAPPAAVWVVATKGWDEDTHRSPSEILASGVPSAPVAVLGGPALAPELVAEVPTALVCASRLPAVVEQVTSLLSAPTVSVSPSDDVAGVETASAYKNVTAVAVGMCEGIAERFSESVLVHAFSNARAAVFAQGLLDMCRLAETRGGRATTVLGLAGAGDLYVTCLGGRNGRFGRLLGVGETAAQAAAAIGSTVEGIANTQVAIALAGRHRLRLPTAEAVHAVLHGHSRPRDALDRILAVLRSA